MQIKQNVFALKNNDLGIKNKKTGILIFEGGELKSNYNFIYVNEITLLQNVIFVEFYTGERYETETITIHFNDDNDVRIYYEN